MAGSIGVPTAYKHLLINGSVAFDVFLASFFSTSSLMGLRDGSFGED